MRNNIRLALLLIATICCSDFAGMSAHAATPIPTPAPTPLNAIKIGQCGNPANLKDWIEDESKRGLVFDARPFAVNQSTGKTSFSGSNGRISVVHMNPFVYNYRVMVAQQELVTTALTDISKLLLPPSLSSVFGNQSGAAFVAGLTPPTKLKQIEQRLNDFSSNDCQNAANPLSRTPACIAVREMYLVFTNMKNTGLLDGALAAGALAPAFTTITAPTIKFRNPALAATSADLAFKSYTTEVNQLRDEESDTYTTCHRAEQLNEKLRGYDFDAYFASLKAAQKAIAQVTTQANDLAQLVTTFNADKELSENKPTIRCKGFNCVGQFDAYARAALEVLGGYSRDLDALRANAEEMQRMYNFTEELRTKDGRFSRTDSVPKKFELSLATVTVNRTKIAQPSQAQASAGAARGAQSGDANSTGGTSPQPAETGGDSSEGTASINSGGNNFAGAGNQSGTPASGNAPAGGAAQPASQAANNLTASGQITEVIPIGRPRHALSAGLVYSPLPRRTFQSVKGFQRDAQGNPTGDGSANIVGFGENSSRRLLPMLQLNTRLLTADAASLFFSFGVSAKQDDNVDIEYLFGPSVGVLNDRALLTFGVYGGKTQNLVSDIAVGDELPDTIGDAKLYRKSYVWKPGFSFSYNFSSTKKKNATGTGAASPADDLKNEIRIGSIPFNLAVGLAYTSLEQRTYDEVVGFARNREGNLTNGRTLTRIVGLSSSSDYRLTPMAMLHTRLTKFGRHDFYFSTGVTGKKTDNSFDVEYLLGGSVNLHRRKIFLTFGAFAGKHQILGGDFFEGAQLAKTQNVTIQNRYVWKPAIAFSYDISRIIPGIR